MYWLCGMAVADNSRNKNDTRATVYTLCVLWLNAWRSHGYLFIFSTFRANICLLVIGW